MEEVRSGHGRLLTENLRARWLPQKGVLLLDLRCIDLPEILGLEPREESKRIPAVLPNAA